MVLARIALRNLLRNRRRSLLTLGALIVGVAVVVGVRGFLNGMQASLVAGVTEGNMGALQVHRKGYMQSAELSPLRLSMAADEALWSRLAELEGVTGVTPRISFGGMINANDETLFAPIVAVDEKRELTVCPKRLDLIGRGRWLREGKSDVIVGTDLWEGLRAEEGLKAALIASDPDGVLNGVEVELAGGLKSITQQDRRVMVMPLHKAQELLRMEGRVTELALQVNDLDDVELVAGRVREALGGEFEVHTWQDLATFVRDVQRNQNAALDMVTWFFLFIMLMGIANTLLMSVLERVREIGTMMAVGTRRRQILALFVWEALFLGVTGAAIGALIGAGAVEWMAHVGLNLSTPGTSVKQLIIPFVRSAFVLRIVTMATVGATLAAFYPAWKASRMRPVEALGAV